MPRGGGTTKRSSRGQARSLTTKQPRLDYSNNELPLPHYNDTSDDDFQDQDGIAEDDSQPSSSVIASKRQYSAAGPTMCLGGFRLQPEPSSSHRCCIAGCNVLLNGPVKIPLCKLRCGLYELRPGTGPLDSVCVDHAAAAAAADCESVASHGPGPAPVPETLVCLLCKASCLAYGVACVRHSLPAPGHLLPVLGAAVRLCASCAHVEATDTDQQQQQQQHQHQLLSSANATTSSAFHFACRRCYSALLSSRRFADVGIVSAGVGLLTDEEVAFFDDKPNKIEQYVEQADDFDDDEVGGYFAALPAGEDQLRQTPTMSSLFTSAQQRGRQRIELAKIVSTALRSSARTGLERRLAECLAANCADYSEAWDRHYVNCQSSHQSASTLLNFGPVCRLCPKQLSSNETLKAAFGCPLISVDKSLIELRPKSNEINNNRLTVRIHLDLGAADHFELRLSSFKSNDTDERHCSDVAAVLLPLPTSASEVACIYLHCLLAELPKLSLCPGVIVDGRSARHSKRCQIILTSEDIETPSASQSSTSSNSRFCCLACRRLAVCLSTTKSAPPSLTLSTDSPLRNLRCLVDLCERSAALKPGTDLFLLLCHAMKSALMTKLATDQLSVRHRQPPLVCHSRLIQLAASLLCFLGTKAYSLLILNLPLGLPTAGELTRCHLDNALLEALQSRDKLAANPPALSSSATASTTRRSKTVNQVDKLMPQQLVVENSAPISRPICVKRVHVTIP